MPTSDLTLLYCTANVIPEDAAEKIRRHLFQVWISRWYRKHQREAVNVV